jgi:hypothetical protein
MTSTPVLLLGFNRPERLAGLIARLRDAKPSAVYVAVDGPRAHVDGEFERVMATREQVASIDWPCEVRTLFREGNLGCGLGVSGGISWLFEQEERGIVLEDDVLPDATFFPFADELLDRYADDARVWAVSGCNFVPPGVLGSRDSYRFSSVPHIWGWGTWRRSWDVYRYDTRGWRKRLSARDLWRISGRSPAGFAYWSAMFDVMALRGVDTWDLQAVLAAFAANGLVATANVNMIDNVGFGSGATHTDIRPDYLRRSAPMSFPLQHPLSVSSDERGDAWTREHVLEATTGGLARQAMRFARRKLTR